MPKLHPVVLNPHSSDERIPGFFLLPAQPVIGLPDVYSRVGYASIGLVAVLKEYDVPHEKIVPITPDNVRQYASGLMDHPAHLSHRIEQSLGYARDLIKEVASHNGQIPMQA